jgi:hypothetical protein
MLVKPLLSHILANDALTRGLSDPEARVLIEWLVEQAERLADSGQAESVAWTELSRLLGRARGIGRFVRLWCHDRARGAAGQLAATERFHWPLPDGVIDPCELMQGILSWESQNLAA